MTDRELLELIATQVGNLTQDVGDLKKGQANLEKKVDSMEKKVDSMEKKVDAIDKTVIRIENEHGNKLTALFDGHKQNADKLDRIEKEVTKQEEIIMRRIK
jgi:chaperonin cofactor prefoldin